MKRSAKQQSCLLTLLLALLCASYAAAETRICLNMIAKNEAEGIMECLEPLAGELAGWTLCDTGSTDDTIKMVEEHFKKESVPGAVANHKWKDFGHNRNLCIDAGIAFSLKEAKRQGMEKGSHFCDYLLFLDADQILHRDPGMERGGIKAMNLTADSYFMTEKGVGVTYKNMRLVSTRVPWEWVGEVHEYVQRKGDGGSRPHLEVPGVWFFHDASGGNDGKRFVRDEVILSRVVKERPGDPRARFYLANTLRSLKRFEEMYTHYIERIRIGGWEEEMFMSALNIADQSKSAWEKGRLISPQVTSAIGNWGSHVIKIDKKAEAAEQKAIDAASAALKKAVDAFNAKNQGNKKEKVDKEEKDEKEDKEAREARNNNPAVKKAKQSLDNLLGARRNRQFPLLVAAYQATSAILPYRPEPYVQLAQLYRKDKDDTAKCFAYAAAGIAQGPPRPDALFLNTNHAEYELWDEMCVCAYYVDRALEQGRDACRKLEKKLTTDISMFPDNKYLTVMLDRTKSNLRWYAKKSPQNALAEECPADAQESCGAGNRGKISEL